MRSKHSSLRATTASGRRLCVLIAMLTTLLVAVPLAVYVPGLVGLSWGALRRTLITHVGVGALACAIACLAIWLLISAERADAAMKHAALSNRIHRYAQEMEALNQVGTKLKASLTSDQIVELVLRALRELLRCDVTAIFLVREARLVIHARRLLSERLARCIKEHVSEALGTVASMQEIGTVVQHNVPLPSDTETHDRALEGDIASFLTTPLAVGGKVTGIMHVASFSPDAFSQDDLRTLSTLSSQVAISLQNADLYSEQLRDNQQLREIQATLESTVERLNREKHKFRSLFDCSLDGIIVIDQDGLIQDFSPALEAMTGWKAEEVVGSARCQDVINCQDEKGGSLCGSRCPFQANGQLLPYVDFRITARNGRKVSISASCFEIPSV